MTSEQSKTRDTSECKFDMCVFVYVCQHVCMQCIYRCMYGTTFCRHRIAIFQSLSQVLNQGKHTQFSVHCSDYGAIAVPDTCHNID